MVNMAFVPGDFILGALIPRAIDHRDIDPTGL